MMSGGTEGFKLISADDSSAVGRWRTLAATLVQGLCDGWLGITLLSQATKLQTMAKLHGRAGAKEMGVGGLDAPEPKQSYLIADRHTAAPNYCTYCSTPWESVYHRLRSEESDTRKQPS